MNQAEDLIGVTGHNIKVLGRTQIMEAQLGPVDIIVVDDIGHQMILGRDALSQRAACIDYAQGILVCDDATLPLVPAPALPSLTSLGPLAQTSMDSHIGQCILSNEDLFAAKGEPLGCHPDIAVNIETEGPPIKRRPYRLPFKKREALDDKLDELLKQGVIVASSSPWASPVVLVEKKDQTEGPRFCVDFTSLNKVTKKDAYPIPLIRDIFDQLQGATVFSTIDLKSGFYQLPLHPDAMEKTAFVCHRGLFHWTRLPMGLCNATQAFQRAMEIVLKGLIGTCCLLYIDDIVVHSVNEEQHVRHLQAIFDRLRQFNLKLNPKKCVFGRSEVELLGYIVSRHGIRATPAKITAITNMAQPASVADIRSFLGMTGYYRQCIKDYAKIANPLVELTKKQAKFVWGEEQQKAFTSLKNALISDHIMAHPQTDKPYIIYTDACDYAIGAIACQLDEQGVERPIVYLSKKLSDTQRRWSTIEKEAFAVFYSLKQLSRTFGEPSFNSLQITSLSPPCSQKKSRTPKSSAGPSCWRSIIARSNIERAN
jgi:hypothetical protein